MINAEIEYGNDGLNMEDEKYESENEGVDCTLPPQIEEDAINDV